MAVTSKWDPSPCSGFLPVWLLRNDAGAEVRAAPPKQMPRKGYKCQAQSQRRSTSQTQSQDALNRRSMSHMKSAQKGKIHEKWSWLEWKRLCALPTSSAPAVFASSPPADPWWGYFGATKMSGPVTNWDPAPLQLKVWSFGDNGRALKRKPGQELSHERHPHIFSTELNREMARLAKSCCHRAQQRKRTRSPDLPGLYATPGSIGNPGWS